METEKCIRNRSASLDDSVDYNENRRLDKNREKDKRLNETYMDRKTKIKKDRGSYRGGNSQMGCSSRGFSSSQGQRWMWFGLLALSLVQPSSSNPAVLTQKPT